MPWALMMDIGSARGTITTERASLVNRFASPQALKLLEI